MDKARMTELAEKASKGSKEAFSELYAECSEPLKKYIIKQGATADEAEDVVSAAFVKAMESISDLREPAYFDTWLHTIAKNEFTASRRRESRAVRIDFGGAEDGSTNESVDMAAFYGAEEDTLLLPEDYAENEDVKRVIAGAVNSLSDEQRDTVFLYYYNELSVGQIAEQMNVPAGTVKSRLSSARSALKKHLKQLQKQGVALCVVPIGSILAFAENNSGKAAAAAAATSAASGKMIAAAVMAVVVGTTGTLIYFNGRNNRLKGDDRPTDSSITEIVDDSSRETTTTPAPEVVPEITEDSSREDEAPATTTTPATTAAPAAPRGTAPSQTAQGNDVPAQADSGETQIQEEKWEDVAFGSYSESGVYNGIKKYYYDPDTGNRATINSMKRELNTGTFVINYTTTKEDNTSFDLCGYIVDNVETGEHHGTIYISPKTVVHDGNNHTITYQNDVIKDNSYSFGWVTFAGTDYDYIDDYGAYNKSTLDEEYYNQNIMLDETGTAHISKDTCEVCYEYDVNTHTSYIWLEFMHDLEIKDEYIDSHIKEILDDIERYGTGKGSGNYFLDDDVPEIKNVIVENGSKYFEMVDGILYFKIHGYRWLLWTTERSPEHLKFPDNVIIYNTPELSKIHMSDINDIDFGNNTWMKNDEAFLDCLDIYIPPEWEGDW